MRLVGVSMGGLGALIYDMEYPREVAEIIVISPFLGEDEVLKEIQTAGGLKKWQPGPVAKKDLRRKLWLGLWRNLLERGNRPQVSLGCGREDRLASSGRLFAVEFLKPSAQE